MNALSDYLTKSGREESGGLLGAYDEKAVIDGKLQMIRAHIKEHPEVTVTYFQPDEKKNGGAYVTVTGFAKKIDTFERVLMINDEISIPIGCIISLML